MLSTLLEKIKRAAVNTECMACRKPVAETGQFCATCHNKLGLRETFPLTASGRFQLYAATLFTPATKNLLYSYKFYGRQSNRPILAELLAHYWQQLGIVNDTLPETTIVTCIPPHAGKGPLVDPIARQFAALAGYRFSNRILHWQRNVEPQHTLHARRKRIDNMKNSLRVEANALYFEPTRIIVVDDLSTTGATLLEAYRALAEQWRDCPNITGLAISHIPLAFQRGLGKTL